MDKKSLQCYANAFLLEGGTALAGVAARSDAELANVHTQVQRLDAMVSILEAKVLLRILVYEYVNNYIYIILIKVLCAHAALIDSWCGSESTCAFKFKHRASY